MSRFAESFGDGEGVRKDHEKASPEFASRYPEMTQALEGLLDEHGCKVVRGPASITLWLELGRLKFVVSPRGSSKVAFGSCQDGADGFAEIEQALERGHFEWKFRSGQKRS